MTAGISLQRTGGYAVQYTPESETQMASLDTAARNRFESHMHMIAAVNPYNHGESTSDIRDRRRVVFEGLAATFWIFQEGSVLTVVEVSKAPETDTVTRFSPFVGFGGEETDDD